MKISFRILIINFAIVVSILLSSAFAFYSVMFNLLDSQQSKYLLNSANNFIYAYTNLQEEVHENFILQLNAQPSAIHTKSNVDFVLSSENNSNIAVNSFNEELVIIPEKPFSISAFIEQNPFAYISSETRGNVIYYYGKIIEEGTLNNLSKRIGAELAVVMNGSNQVVSNSAINEKYISTLIKAKDNLLSKKNFEVYSSKDDGNDILAAIYIPSGSSQRNNNLKFLIFSSISETADLSSSLKSIVIIIGTAGVVLALILSFVFTDKIRKQIISLSKATEATREGNFRNKIKIHSKDELGKLANAFNAMFDVLEKNEKINKNYSEFITLLNQNPTLNEISEAALSKIISACSFNVGALYTVESEKVNFISSYGINYKDILPNQPEIFQTIIKTKKPVEITFNNDCPRVSTGLVTLEIKYLLILPVISNNKVIAVLDLGAVSPPSDEAKDYLYKIQEQLAIGITNAIAFVQLENLVSELKNLNEDYQRQNIQIRKQNETLIELHNKIKEKADELALQKQKAEESTKLKSQFLASMSHELRTPLNSILGLTELILEEGSFTGRNKDRLEVVLKSGKRLMNLINDILDLTKIEAGKMELREEDIFLDELIRDIETSISPLIVHKDIEFKVERNSDTRIIIRLDRGKVIQVLINLLGNAVKFTERGTVEMHVSTTDKDLIFDVIDSGIGMSEEEQQVIFEEFRQLDGTSTRKYNGTGLGLAICKKITDFLEGRISVKSKVGKGSIFSFSIPLKIVEKNPIELPTAQTSSDYQKVRRNPILIIDDDPEIRYTIGQYLISKGYEVVFAENSIAGINEAVSTQPFAITLDIMLPFHYGWDALINLKENPVTKDIPVILISIIQDKNFGYGIGAFDYFVKPIKQDDLIGDILRLEHVSDKRIERIVIVDNNDSDFEKLKHEIKDHNLRIDYIQDSEIAFSKILEMQPDLIILDLMMKGLDGITLSYKLKSNRETKHIPVIISMEKYLPEVDKESLTNIVENITLKSKHHPLDVLKIVRDRIIMREMYTDIKIPSGQITIPKNKLNGKEGDYLCEVLIVDDDPDTLYTIDEIVQSTNCKTLLAKNGIDCLAVLETKTPDLILLDIMMPEMDGFQTLKKIKENPRTASIPVFAITAKAMLDDKAVIIKHGFDDYIPKPVNAGIIAFKIKKLLFNLKLS